MTRSRGGLTALVIGSLVAAVVACGGGGSGGIIVGPAPTPTGSAGPTPGPCGTPVANAVFVAMASYITATTDPTYGIINGYALVAIDGTYSNVAQPIQIRPGDTLQFVNVEPAPDPSQAPIQHSAISLQGAVFPTPVPTPSPSASPGPTPTPIFPSSAQSATGSTISSSLWSTGRVPASETDTLCYSPTFTTATQGTYAFGDYDYYAITNMRDVIVVSSSATRARLRNAAAVVRRRP